MGALFTKLMLFLLDLLLFIPRKVWQWFTEALAFISEQMPVPDFLFQSGSAFGGITSDVVWFLDVAQFDFGLPLIVSAYVIRFGIRRLPFIG